MNKFILVALIAASVAIANAAIVPGGMDDEVSELALNPNDEDETRSLDGTNLEGFRDFCIRTRDTVIQDLKNRGNVFTSDVFNSLFRTIGEVAESSIKANQKATDRLGRQLVNPAAAIDESGNDKVDQIIADGQKAIQAAQNQGEGLLSAFTSGIKSFAAAGYGKAVEKITELQQTLGARVISKDLIAFCEQLSDYEKQAIDIFEETKSGLVEENAEQYKNVKFSDVAPKCITANRLSRADGFCKFVLAAKVPLAKVFRFELPADNSEH